MIWEDVYVVCSQGIMHISDWLSSVFKFKSKFSHSKRKKIYIVKILKASTTREEKLLKVIQDVDGDVSSSEQILHTNDSSAVTGAFRK